MADNINVSGLQKTWDSFGNPIVIDSKGNIVDVVYGGANNDIVSMTTRGSIGGDPVTNYYDANGNFTHATSNNPTVEGGKNFVVDYDASGKAYKREYNPDEWGDIKRIVSTIGAAALGGAGAGSWLGGTLGLGTGALGSAAGGALIGGGLAGVTGQDVAKGALLGGLGGYVQGSGGIDGLLGNTSNDFFPIGGTAGTTLTPAAIESGLGTAGYGLNAAAASSGLFNPSLVGLNANAGVNALNTGTSQYGLDFGKSSNLSSMNGGTGLTNTSAANLADMGGGQGLTVTNGANSTTLQDALDTFGGVSKNLDTMNGGTGLTTNTNTTTGNVVSQGGVNTGFNVTDYLNNTVGAGLGKTLNNIDTGINSTVTNNTSTTKNGLSTSDTIKLLGLAGGLLGGTSALTGGGSRSSAVPTQGVPTQSPGYYNAIQQYYNAYMPNQPRDVAGPLEQWYNNSYGKAATTGSTTTPNTAATTAPVNTQANFKTAVPGAVAGLLTTPALAQASAVDKANLYNTMLSSGMSDAAIRQAVTERVGAQTNNDWNYLQGLGAAQALQGASITPQAVQNIQGLESGDKAIAYNSLLDSGLNDAQIRNLVESKMGAQTNNDWQYLTKMAGVQKVQYGTPIEKAQAYNEMLATGMNDADVRKLVEQAVGNQPDADWQYLKQLASSI